MLPLNTSLPASGIRSFGYQRSETHVHNGIDLPAKRGAPVVAVADGVVTHASSVWQQGFTGYGRHVVIKHPDGTWSLYAHLQDVRVSVGQPVTEGTVIGSAGNSIFSKEDHTQESGGVHLHFEISPRAYPQPSSSARLDPIAYLSGGKSSSRAHGGAAELMVLGAFALAGSALIFRKRRRA